MEPKSAAEGGGQGLCVYLIDPSVPGWDRQFDGTGPLGFVGKTGAIVGVGIDCRGEFCEHEPASIAIKRAVDSQLLCTPVALLGGVVTRKDEYWRKVKIKFDIEENKCDVTIGGKKVLDDIKFEGVKIPKTVCVGVCAGTQHGHTNRMCVNKVTLKGKDEDAQIEHSQNEPAPPEDEEVAEKKKAEAAAAAEKKAEDEAAAEKKKAEDEAAAEKKKAEDEAAAEKKKAEEAAEEMKAKREAARKTRLERAKEPILDTTSGIPQHCHDFEIVNDEMVKVDHQTDWRCAGLCDESIPRMEFGFELTQDEAKKQTGHVLCRKPLDTSGSEAKAKFEYVVEAKDPETVGHCFCCYIVDPSVPDWDRDFDGTGPGGFTGKKAAVLGIIFDFTGVSCGSANHVAIKAPDGTLLTKAPLDCDVITPMCIDEDGDEVNAWRKVKVVFAVDDHLVSVFVDKKNVIHEFALTAIPLLPKVVCIGMCAACTVEKHAHICVNDLIMTNKEEQQ